MYECTPSGGRYPGCIVSTVIQWGSMVKEENQYLLSVITWYVMCGLAIYSRGLVLSLALVVWNYNICLLSCHHTSIRYQSCFSFGHCPTGDDQQIFVVLWFTWACVLESCCEACIYAVWSMCDHFCPLFAYVILFCDRMWQDWLVMLLECTGMKMQFYPLVLLLRMRMWILDGLSGFLLELCFARFPSIWWASQ